MGSNTTREFVFVKPSGGVKGNKTGTLPGIDSMYHFTYEFDVEGKFFGLRVFRHAGIGTGKFYSASACQNMWIQEGGLTADMCGELKCASNITEAIDVAFIT